MYTPLTHLLDVHNIPYYTADFGPRYKKNKHIRRGWIAFPTCPFCGGTDKYWLGYNLEKRYAFCWNHGFTDMYKLVRHFFPKENANDLLITCGVFRTGGSFTSGNFSNIPIEHRTPGKFDPPTPIYPLSSSIPHQEYLRSRGLDWEQLASRYAVGAILHATKSIYNNRLFIPVWDRKGVPTSWQTRAIYPNAKIPYLAAAKTAEAAPIKSLLYGMNFVTHFGTIIVTEGVVDAWKINYNGNNHAVATFGKELTPFQIRLISQYACRIFCFDNEPKAQEQARNYCTQLSVYPGVTHNVCLDAPDPAVASQREIDTLLRFAFA